MNWGQRKAALAKERKWAQSYASDQPELKVQDLVKGAARPKRDGTLMIRATMPRARPIPRPSAWSTLSVGASNWALSYGARTPSGIGRRPALPAVKSGQSIISALVSDRLQASAHRQHNRPR